MLKTGIRNKNLNEKAFQCKCCAKLISRKHKKVDSMRTSTRHWMNVKINVTLRNKLKTTIMQLNLAIEEFCFCFKCVNSSLLFCLQKVNPLRPTTATFLTKIWTPWLASRLKYRAVQTHYAFNSSSSWDWKKISRFVFGVISEGHHKWGCFCLFDERLSMLSSESLELLIGFVTYLDPRLWLQEQFLTKIKKLH